MVRENREKLSPVVSVYIEERLTEGVVLVLLCPLVEPLIKSPTAVADRAWNKRFREIASKPKIAALDLVAVGVEGIEFFPVRNLNRPYW